MNEIPPMTDPISVHWNQPPRERIAIDDTHALMSSADFKALLEYSTSRPSGVYDGKMWKRREPQADGRSLWVLMWYGPADDPRLCSINRREILIADEAPRVKERRKK